MSYQANPFLERMSERTTSDQDFVRLFSPKILERLPEDAFEGAVHIFRSPPGGGKTTLLRAFTPTALRAFWNARKLPEMNEAFQRLISRRVLDESEGPQLLGVYLSCASGYADLPPGATFAQEGLLRALLDCRIVLRTLRNLQSFLGFASIEQLDTIKIEYDEPALDIKSIPLASTAKELVVWAEQHERCVYAQLDALESPPNLETPAHVRFEGILWLQGIRFIRDGKNIAPQRLLMIDDLHKLRRKQRELLIEELTELRPRIPIWLSERNIALGSELLSQGAREGRDLRQYDLEELWNSSRGYQFAAYAQNILERRLSAQDVIPKGNFALYLRSEFASGEMQAEIAQGSEKFLTQTQRHRTNTQYTEWLHRADVCIAEASIDSLRELYTTLILIVRNEGKRQLSLELMPLSSEELEGRDSSQVQGAAEIFMHDDLKIPYFFGIDRLYAMATNNVEELLGLAAALYEGLQAKQILRRPELLLSPNEQEKLLKEVSKRKRDFIPKSHTEGTRAQRLLDSMGVFCREKTFQLNAPYAPGVTGIRLTIAELEKLHRPHGLMSELIAVLRNVISECVAENLLVARSSTASTSRDAGTVFYMNRTLCAHYSLPLQFGGWQDVKVEEMIDWMQFGRMPARKKLLETN